MRAVIALLEDFRPESYQQDKAKRKDLYILRSAFEYVLQRIATNYLTDPTGPHYVIYDYRSDWPDLSTIYSQLFQKGQRLPYSTIPPLSENGFHSALLVSNSGALNEIADFVASAMTRWAGTRCKAHKGATPPDRAEFDRACSGLLPLFPVKPGSGERRGYSVVTFTQNRTGKELLRDHLETWIAEVAIPF